MAQVTSRKRSTASSKEVAASLEEHGFLRSVAGDEEFAKAVKAVCAAITHGMGLFITGNAGCGKTQLMKAVMGYYNSSRTRFLYVKEPKVLGWMKDNPEFYLDANVYVDDIGCEEVVREYGNTTDVVGDFVQIYHLRGQKKFFGTTNLDSTALNQRYGTRVLDRLMDMCVVLKMNGESKRERIIIQ